MHVCLTVLVVVLGLIHSVKCCPKARDKLATCVISGLNKGFLHLLGECGTAFVSDCYTEEKLPSHLGDDDKENDRPSTPSEYDITINKPWDYFWLTSLT